MTTNDMNQTPMGNRYHIAIFGKRNAGKSTLMNGLTKQEISVVSNVAGTTTDPVYKSMELLPVGPVVFIDTAGFDDIGELGALRIKKTRQVLRKTDLALVVLDAQEEPDRELFDFLKEIRLRSLPCLAVINKCDAAKPSAGLIKLLESEQISYITGSAYRPDFIGRIKEAVIQAASTLKEEPPLLEGVVRPGDLAVLVTPIDSAAPKGRMILPQQQTIRAILDADAMMAVTKENRLKETLDSLAVKPSIVITDSQAFRQVSAQTPEDILLTSFSILFARQKGELKPMVKGALAADRLKAGDKVLIVEGCTHHRQSDDIGTVKIPRWLREKAGDGLEFAWASGTGFPEDLTGYAMIIHCGACMLNQREMRYRMQTAREQNVPMTNYGMLIAHVMGILPRALKPFREEIEEEIQEEG